ncbi:MAG: GPR endopeptidase [Clostridia bacterium]|nr:GPR endopeptidase [Clostridia bacterium]
MEDFARSDLAAECGAGTEGEGVRVSRAEAGGCEILRVQIKSEEAAARIRKPQGRYVTVECGNIRMLDEVESERVSCALAVEIREMAERMCGRRVGQGFSVLVAGLGNAEITPDAVGPETVRRLSVTRHLRRFDTALFSTLGLCEIAALTPGVLGQTGLETVELVQGAARSAQPDLVIAVDALAARSTDRLAATVQLSDTGIHPGSGIGNARRALNRETVGVPVMAIGVPTVVDSATLAADLLARAGHTEPDEALRAELENGRSFFVAPKEIDLLVSSVGVLLAAALEKAFTV